MVGAEVQVREEQGESKEEAERTTVLFPDKK